MPSTMVPSLKPAIRLFRAESGKNELLGFADLVIADAFVIKGIRILRAKPEGEQQARVFISFPQRKGKGKDEEERYFGVAHPITKDAHAKALESIVSAYDSLASQSLDPLDS